MLGGRRGYIKKPKSFGAGAHTNPVTRRLLLLYGVQVALRSLNLRDRGKALHDQDSLTHLQVILSTVERVRTNIVIRVFFTEKSQSLCSC